VHEGRHARVSQTGSSNQGHQWADQVMGGVTLEHSTAHLFIFASALPGHIPQSMYCQATGSLVPAPSLGNDMHLF